MKTGMASRFGASFLFLYLGVFVATGAGLGIAEEAIKSRLGLGFGNHTVIEGVLFEGQETGRKADLGKKLIRVDRVDGRELPETVILEIRTISLDLSSLPNSGTRFRCRGYESGGFVGIPAEALEDAATVAATGFHFANWFVVTRIMESKTQSETERSNER